MADKHLATYLNDHLAGAIAGSELLDYLIASYAGEAAEPMLRQVHAEVVEDRLELERLMTHLGVKQSVPRKAAAWVGEKFAQLKLRVDDLSHDGALRRFEAAEAISLGIEGKRSLWLALRRLAHDTPDVRALDYDDLIRRAESQRGRVDGLRMEECRRAFAVGSAASVTG